MKNLDVLCVGHFCYDQYFSLDHHPEEDEKMESNDLVTCGGGPAGNAAVQVARLGYRSAAIGYLGNDTFGDALIEEFNHENVDTQCIVRDEYPTPITSILVKPNGTRTAINNKSGTPTLKAGRVVFSVFQPKVILFDGHEPDVSMDIMEWSMLHNTITLLDAGSLREGTEKLAPRVNILAASEKFAKQMSGSEDLNDCFKKLSEINSNVVITLGKKGLLWKSGEEDGKLGVYQVKSVDTTGAGDAFHGALAAKMSEGFELKDCLEYASAAGALCCTKTGARFGLPEKEELDLFLQKQESLF